MLDNMGTTHRITIYNHELEFMSSAFSSGVVIPPQPDDVDMKLLLEAVAVAIELFPLWEEVHVLTESEEFREDPHRIASIVRALQDCRFKEYADGLWKKLEPHLIADRERNERYRANTRTSSSVGYVYLLQSASGSYKIGRAVNPKNRLKTFEVKLPFEVEFIALIKTSDMHGLERSLHDRFADKRVNGEWFNLEPEDIEYIKSLQGE